MCVCVDTWACESAAAENVEKRAQAHTEISVFEDINMLLLKTVVFSAV